MTLQGYVVTSAPYATRGDCDCATTCAYLLSLNDTRVEALQRKQMLLVFDNCEHVVSACAAMADLLLQGRDSSEILATSRELLNIAGENVYGVRSLPPPQGDDVDADRIVGY